MNHQIKRRSMQSNVLAVPFCEMSPTSLSLPEGLTYDQWLEIGHALGRAQGSVMWAIGDWWVFGEHHYGERTTIIRSDDWDGPKYQTCANAGTVCFRFRDVSSREETVSFRNHQAIAPIGDEEWRSKILAWAATRGENGERPTRSAIEERVREVRAHLSQGWTPTQIERKSAAEAGQCVVANMREQDGQQIDAALLAWAEANDRFARIDRKTEWGNPFEIPDDGERADVDGKFSKFYLPYKDGLLSRMPSLRGKVLGCWCHPEECHGHIIAEIVNAEAEGKGSAAELADQLAEVDG
jgi:hypothetical protein